MRERPAQPTYVSCEGKCGKQEWTWGYTWECDQCSRMTRIERKLDKMAEILEELRLAL